MISWRRRDATLRGQLTSAPPTTLRDNARELVARFPSAELGCFYLDATGKPVGPDPASSEFPKLTRHHGSVKGAWPRNVDG